jgi:hypothetical protein
MILQNRNDLFKVELPRVFIPKEIKARYEPYLFRMPTPITDVSDLVNYSIQSITIPNFNYQPVEQTKPGYYEQAKGTVRKFRQALSPELLIDRTFTITFQLLDGNVNYWIMLETFFHYYNYNTTNPYHCDVPLRIFDAEGMCMYTSYFKDCLFTGLNQFTLSYSDITPEFRTFEANFSFNDIQIDFQVQ